MFQEFNLFIKYFKVNEEMPKMILDSCWKQNLIERTSFADILENYTPPFDNLKA